MDLCTTRKCVPFYSEKFKSFPKRRSLSHCVHSLQKTRSESWKKVRIIYLNCLSSSNHIFAYILNVSARIFQPEELKGRECVSVARIYSHCWMMMIFPSYTCKDVFIYIKPSNLVRKSVSSFGWLKYLCLFIYGLRVPTYKTKRFSLAATRS